MTQDLLTAMRRRLADAEADAERLRAAIAVLEAGDVADGSRSAAVGVSPTPRRRRRTSPAEKRSTPVEAVGLDKLLVVLGEHPAQTTGELGKLTGGAPAQLLVLLKEAEAAGQVRRTGERRATRWSVITDEDRIAARVRELEQAAA